MEVCKIFTSNSNSTGYNCFDLCFCETDMYNNTNYRTVWKVFFRERRSINFFVLNFDKPVPRRGFEYAPLIYMRVIPWTVFCTNFSLGDSKIMFLDFLRLTKERRQGNGRGRACQLKYCFIRCSLIRNSMWNCNYMYFWLCNREIDTYT